MDNLTLLLEAYSHGHVRFITRAIAAIERIAGSESAYTKQAQRYINLFPGMEANASTASSLLSIVHALRADVIGGFLKSARELIHGELFSDFLDMSGYLLSEGYKDAAAVMAGGVLESHLHQLCIKKGIDVVNAAGNAKKASQLNDELFKEKVYGMADSSPAARISFPWCIMRAFSGDSKPFRDSRSEGVKYLNALTQIRCGSEHSPAVVA